MPTLTWPGKRPVALPEGKLRLDSCIYPHGRGHSTQPENRLILGDNLAVMAALLPEFEGRIQVIYADPPFFTNRRFRARIGRGEDSRRPQEWQLAEGYADHWPNLDAYLDFLYPRLILMHRLLAPGGTLYLHLDWHANAYARVLLDEIFGPERLLNEIVWVYHGPSPIRSAFNRKHDTILAYTKSANYYFNADAVREPYHPNTVKTFQSSPKAGFGKVPDLKRGKVPEDWWYFPVVARLHNERTGYPTQKPEALLERILRASSREGDWVADFFCGSGTTAVVAARLGRRFLACDATWRAVHTTRRRLVETPDAPPFTLEYEARSPLPTDASPTDTYPRISGSQVYFPKDFLNKVDYWEILRRTGDALCSVAQALRPLRSTELAPLSLPLPPEATDLVVRWVALDGAHGAWTL